MSKTILLTGATDGIGLEVAKILIEDGHQLLLHGRNPDKLNTVASELSGMASHGVPETYIADMSRISDVEKMADAVMEKHDGLDVLINNAGVLKTGKPVTDSGMDVRFLVNTLAPYVLTRRLLPLMGRTARVVNLSSAAQAPVDESALRGQTRISDDNSAYAQSKLAITMWSRAMAAQLGNDGPAIIAVNPGSLLATKMVKEGYAIPGNDIGIGANIICRAALSDDFADASGQYFDNDARRFANPHPDALDPDKCDALVQTIEATLANIAT